MTLFLVSPASKIMALRSLIAMSWSPALHAFSIFLKFISVTSFRKKIFNLFPMALFSTEGVAGNGEAKKENYAPTNWQALNLLCQWRRMERRIALVMPAWRSESKNYDLSLSFYLAKVLIWVSVRC